MNFCEHCPLQSISYLGVENQPNSFNIATIKDIFNDNCDVRGVWTMRVKTMLSRLKYDSGSLTA